MKVHQSFEKVNTFSAHEDPNKLRLDSWPYKSRQTRKAVYLLVQKGKVIKVGQSIDFYRRMDNYKYRQGYACAVLTPVLNKMIVDNGSDIELYVRFYDQALTRVDEWGEEVLQTDCVFAAEKKWKEYYSSTIMFK
jgi:hypothetical protein